MVSSAVDKMFRSLCHNLQRMFLFSFPWPSIILLLYSFSIRHCKEINYVVDLSLPVIPIELTFGKIQGPQIREHCQDGCSVLWSVLERVPEHHQ